MVSQKIVYPKSLKDIPLWRQRQIEEDLLWFSRFSPCERLRYIDREWEEIQAIIKKFYFFFRRTSTLNLPIRLTPRDPSSQDSPERRSTTSFSGKA